MTEDGLAQTRAERRHQLQCLGRYAKNQRPLLFALFGIYNGVHGMDPQPYCHWGVEWPGERAILFDHSGQHTWSAASADALLRRHNYLGDAQLLRFDP